MRSTLLPALIFAISAIPARAAVDWQEYVYPEDHFSVHFPVPPSMSTEIYETSITGPLTARVYSAEYDNILFKVRVIELGNEVGHGANFAIEAAYELMRVGEVIFTDFTRVGTLGHATFGIGMIVDAEDGRRIRSSLYSDNERFYLVEAIVMPERGDLDQLVPSRFEQTLRFDLEAPLNSEVIEDTLP
jgi:hypothetical protein